MAKCPPSHQAKHTTLRDFCQVGKCPLEHRSPGGGREGAKPRRADLCQLFPPACRRRARDPQRQAGALLRESARFAGTTPPRRAPRPTETPTTHSRGLSPPASAGGAGGGRRGAPGGAPSERRERGSRCRHQSRRPRSPCHGKRATKGAQGATAPKPARTPGSERSELLAAFLAAVAALPRRMRSRTVCHGVSSAALPGRQFRAF